MNINKHNAERSKPWRFFSALTLVLLGSYALLQEKLSFHIIRGMGHSIQINGMALFLAWAAILAGSLVLTLVALRHLSGQAGEANLREITRRGEYVAWSLLAASFIAAVLMNQ